MNSAARGLGVIILCAIIFGCINGGYAPSAPLYFLYVPNYTNSDFSVFSVNSASGNLTPITNSPFSAGNHPSSAAVDPSGQFLFISNNTSDTIQSFSINSVTGTPTLVGVIANPNGPYVLTADPNGNFVYSINNGSVNCISGYTINFSSGALTEMANSPFACGGAGNHGTVDPTGKFIFVAGTGLGGVVGFTINPTTGSLTEVTGSPFTCGTTPHQLAIDPAGKFLFAANQNSDNVTIFKIDTTTGRLTPAGQTLQLGNPSCVVFVSRR